MARLASSGRSPSPTKRATAGALQSNNPSEDPFQTQSKIRRSVSGALGAPSSLQPTIEEDEDELQLTDTRERRIRFELGGSDEEYTHDHGPIGQSYTEEEEEFQDTHIKKQQGGSAQAKGPTALSKGPELGIRVSSDLSDQVLRLQAELTRERQLRQALQRTSISTQPPEFTAYDRYAKELKGLDIHPWDDNPVTLRSFITDILMEFSIKPRTYHSEDIKVKSIYG
jgi:hypothetical protein